MELLLCETLIGRLTITLSIIIRYEVCQQTIVWFFVKYNRLQLGERSNNFGYFLIQLLYIISVWWEHWLHPALLFGYGWHKIFSKENASVNHHVFVVNLLQVYASCCYMDYISPKFRFQVILERFKRLVFFSVLKLFDWLLNCFVCKIIDLGIIVFAAWYTGCPKIMYTLFESL